MSLRKSSARVKPLREGFTTGTCAAAAAKAAAICLTGGELPGELPVSLPNGARLSLPVKSSGLKGSSAWAVVTKFAGDDPDITDGVDVEVQVAWTDKGTTEFKAGEGVGTVTKKGLQIAPGEPAINPVPREQIKNGVEEVTGRPVTVTVSIPGGRQLAKRTFNPRLGIVDGLSVLGTSGIVRPYSHPAIRESLKCTLDVAVAGGVDTPVFTAGNIGTRTALESFNLSKDQVIEVSNEWGFMLDCAAQKNIRSLLAMGHPGKLAKLTAGDWDTHSSRSGSALPVVEQLAVELFGKKPPESTTVEGIFTELEIDNREKLATELSRRIRAAISDRINKKFDVAVALVDMQGGVTGHYGEIGLWKKENR